MSPSTRNKFWSQARSGLVRHPLEIRKKKESCDGRLEDLDQVRKCPARSVVCVWNAVECAQFAVPCGLDLRLRSRASLGSPHNNNNDNGNGNSQRQQPTTTTTTSITITELQYPSPSLPATSQPNSASLDTTSDPLSSPLRSSLTMRSSRSPHPESARSSERSLVRSIFRPAPALYCQSASEIHST